MREVWLPVVGHKWRYEVSSYGRVRSKTIWLVRRNRVGRRYRTLHRGRILTLVPDGRYLCVSLYRRGKMIKASVHRLVAQAFLINPENKPEVNHIDNDGTNNFVDNLEWVTEKENSEHAVSIGRIGGAKGEAHGHAKLTPILVRKVQRRYKTTNLSQAAVAREFDLNQSTVSRLVTGKRWGHLNTGA